VDACRYLSKSKNSEGVDKYVFAPGNITDFRHWRKVLSKAGIKTNKVFLSGNTKRNTFPENAAPRARLAVSFLLPSNQDVVKKISGFEAVTVSYSRASAIAYAKLRVAQESSMLRAQGAEIIGVHSFEDGDDIMFEIYYLPSAK